MEEENEQQTDTFFKIVWTCMACLFVANPVLFAAAALAMMRAKAISSRLEEDPFFSQCGQPMETFVWICIGAKTCVSLHLFLRHFVIHWKCPAAYWINWPLLVGLGWLFIYGIQMLTRATLDENCQNHEHRTAWYMLTSAAIFFLVAVPWIALLIELQVALKTRCLKTRCARFCLHGRDLSDSFRALPS